MQSQNVFWTAGLLAAAFLQTVAVTVSVEDVTTNGQTSTLLLGVPGEEPLNLKASEGTPYFEPYTRQHLFGSDYHSVYHQSSHPIFAYFTPLSNLPDSTSSFFFFGQNTSDGIHQRIKCGDTFPRACQHSRYRSYDGSCNNLQNPTWGMANTRYGRLIRPRYSDGIQTPPRSVTGANLPLARTVSHTMFPNLNIDDRIWTLVAMQFGQIMTHDMGLIDGVTQSTSHSIRCCTFDGQVVPHQATLPRCYPILIAEGDPVYSSSSVRCLNFVRSTTDLDRGCSSPRMPAQQLNTVTHYLDLSLVYGSSDQVAASLRAGFGGRLNAELRNNREFPPTAANKSAICETMYEHEPCYATGDLRANQNPQLTILHIVLLREHNHIANYLANLNPHWTDETIFQETRRIVIAEYQHIAYYEWMPIFLGREQIYRDKITYNTDGYVNDYDETVNGNTLNEHSTAASRYFHTLIAGNLNLVAEDRHVSPFYNLRLSDHFNRPGIIEKGNNLDDLTRGLVSQPQRDADVYFDKEITQYLFRRGRALGSDLRATDIQRDRDHGLASYNDFREYCGLSRAKSFMDFADYISFSDIHKLSTLYDSPDDVELTVGGSLERHITDTLAGPTFLCIMTRQFQQTRIGDRYWFETQDPEVAFTIEQLNEIRKSSISRLLCDNGDHIRRMQRAGFHQVSVMNPLLNCDQLPQMDLSYWKDYGSNTHDSDYQHLTSPQYKK
ncbi:peroxidase isoform X1 [Harpegnathos saltator]|uniref:peroxidase isoform X1 n=1 Tax=Harpegnathos saltator TaxID=610380 RepID=UPI00058B2619|nr:peroxidase isoform X1 [Harpegnathos saltator]XP_011136248.1 peroxidase isoform X1 [Harpegnathos saltator]XP_025153280.1 peroxidase isoform X1 [Harpegnathos saltator]XP_025153281.1 peroxidase isoform X1 [Harpegnathos saltator]